MMLKRRPLGGNKDANKDKNSNTGSQQQGQSHRPPQKQGQPQRHGQQQKQNQNQQKNQQRRKGRHGNRRPQHRPAPPPAFMQRDLLLVPNKENIKSIEDVRLRFDPLSKKLPAHVTILFPEPAAKVAGDLLKKTDTKELPSLAELTFKAIQIIDEMYLWLMPDEESTEKLKKWHAIFSSQVAEHTQGDSYTPHITLGYIPRKVPEEEALAFAQNLISTPLTLRFDHLMLEEFSEDQNSRLLDRFQIRG